MNFEPYLKYIPLGMFFAFGIKTLLTSATLTDAALLLVLGGVAGYYEWKSQTKATALLHARCNEIDKHLNDFKKTQDEMKGYISGLKLAQASRSPFSGTAPGR